MERHDKHRDVRRVLECLQEVQQVPTSFEGVPDELLDDKGNAITPLQIGETVGYSKKSGWNAGARTHHRDNVEWE